MALKFNAPKKAAPAPRKRAVKRGVLAAARTPAKRVVVQEYAAIDQFGELPARKRAAERQAQRLGHDLAPWHRRTNDPAGRFNAFCEVCNRAAVVCTETPPDFPDSYGPALTDDCVSGASSHPESSGR
jgi:hypothetical protein